MKFASMISPSSRFLRLLIGFFALSLLTFPFIWGLLQFNFTEGTVRTVFSIEHGLKFLGGLWPGLILIGIIGTCMVLAKKFKIRTFCSQNIFPFIHNKITHPFTKIGLVLVLIAGCLIMDNQNLHKAILVGIYMLQALGLNIAVGMTGLLVLGYASFFAVGGYSFAITQQFIPGLPWWLALPFVFVIGLVVGWLVGLPCLRLRGDYLAIVTLGFGESFRELMRNLSSLTGGDKGLRVGLDSKIQAIATLNIPQTTYLIVLTCVLVTVFLIWRLYHSPVGRAWIAIREDEIAATAMGIPVVKMKLLAFSLSSACAAVAGVLYVAYIGFIDPSCASFQDSAMVLAMVILGGLGSIPGVLLGAALLYLIPVLLRTQIPALNDYRLLFFGIIIVSMMLFRPQGLLGSQRHRLEIEEEKS